MYLVIKVGSITNAQRAKSVLRGRGFRPILSRIENPGPSDGCGYVVKVYTNDDNKAIRILENAGVSILGVEVE